jgi:hypothetical protein
MYYAPSQLTQRPFVASIPPSIRFNLVFPKSNACFGQSENLAVLVAVPKATIHYQHTSIFGENQIRLTWQILYMQPISETKGK